MKTQTLRARAPRSVSRRPAPDSKASPLIAFKAFIAYADLPAARQAMNTINEVLSVSGQPYHLEPMLWRFDQLAHPRWREQAFVNAAEGNVIVLASSSSKALPPTVEQWVNEFMGQRLNARTTLVALLGQDDAWTISIEGTATAVVPVTTDVPAGESATPFAASGLASCAA